MSHTENYEALVFKVYDEGTDTEDRTGVGTRHLPGQRMVYDLRDGFPLITTKKTWFKGAAIELLWMLSGSSNIKELQDQNVHIWDEWADENGDLGRVYGTQLRDWRSVSLEGATVIVDQIKELEDGLKNNPSSRRHILTMWNPGELGDMKLPPCHIMSQFIVDGDTLHCVVYQRSMDLFLGGPFDLVLYGLLTHLLAQTHGFVPGTLTYNIGDAHIYANHFEQVETLLDRPNNKPLPQLIVKNTKNSITEYTLDDFVIEGYDYYDHISAPIAV